MLHVQDSLASLGAGFGSALADIIHLRIPAQPRGAYIKFLLPLSCRKCMYNRIGLSHEYLLCSVVHLCLHTGIAAGKIHFNMLYLSSFSSHDYTLSIINFQNFHF